MVNGLAVRFLFSVFIFLFPSLSALAVNSGLLLNQNSCNAYQGLVKSLGFNHHWSVGSLTGSSAADLIGSNTGTLQGSPTKSIAGPLYGSSASLLLNGSSQYVSTATSFTNPDTFTANIWFRTSTTTGGKIMGFGNNLTGASSNYDRHLYMTNSGTLIFGVYSSGFVTLTSASSYNDNQWYMATTSMSASGMRLYINGVLIASNAQTTGQAFSGYWRFGYDAIITWPSPPTSYFFQGHIAEPAVRVGAALTDAQVLALYNAARRCQ